MDKARETPCGDRETTTVVPVCIAFEEPARLRHELVTPVNHLVGYAELLIDEAEARGRHELLPGLTRLLGHSREVLARIDAALAPAESRGYAADRLHQTLDRIVVEGAILRVLVGLDQEVFDADLEKIRGATQRLRGLIERAFPGRGAAVAASA